MLSISKFGIWIYFCLWLLTLDNNLTLRGIISSSVVQLKYY